MTDTFTKEKRSSIMAQVKSKNTQPELLLRKLLFSSGIRYRLHYDIEGKPDIVIVSKKIAIFIDGCFWHKCPKCFRPPKSKEDYWEPKIDRNIKRDKEVNKILKSKGWKVIRIWEHQVKKNPHIALAKILKKI